MTAQLSHIVFETSPGLLRAVAFAHDGRPWHIFQQLWAGEREAVRAGQVIEARVRGQDESGGVFLDHIGWTLWEGGFEPLYCDRKNAQGLNEGQTLNVRVMSAARRDHVARVIPSDADVALSRPENAFHDWASMLGLSRIEEIATEISDVIDAAYDDVTALCIGLSGGGVIHVERTRGLTVIDVDSAGRKGRGSAAARALSLNKQAVLEAARQICLHALGGVFAIDCVEPLTDEAKTQLRDAIVEAFKENDTRHLSAQKPSRFGVLEAATAWRSTPILEILDRSDMGLALALQGAFREMSAETRGFYTLELGPATYQAYVERKRVVDQQIEGHFHGRLELKHSHNGREALRRRV